MKAKKDGRRNNGRPDTGLTEAHTLVRCPKALLDDMRAAAAASGVSLAQAWRLAALLWLKSARR